VPLQRLKTNSHMPCRAASIHTCRAASLPFSDSAVSFVKVRVMGGNIRTATRTRAGRPHAVSGRPILIHTCHTIPMPRCAVTLRSRCQNGMVMAWQGRSMACVNQTRPHCVNQTGKTPSKPLAARHGTATAWYV
jgi:hypothetical protein